MRTMFPGEIMDYYVLRREYDATMHHLELKKAGGDWD